MKSHIDGIILQRYCSYVLVQKFNSMMCHCPFSNLELIRRYILGSTCEEPVPVSGEILDPPSFASPHFPPLASLLPLQLRGSSCQPLADTPQRTRTLNQTLQIHQKQFSSVYLPLRWPTDGVPASLFPQLPLHLKEQHGNCQNFNRLHEHHSQERNKRC